MTQSGKKEIEDGVLDLMDLMLGYNTLPKHLAQMVLSA